MYEILGAEVLGPLNSQFLPCERREVSSFTDGYLLNVWSLQISKIESHSIFICKARESIKQNINFCTYQRVPS